MNPLIFLAQTPTPSGNLMTPFWISVLVLVAALVAAGVGFLAAQRKYEKTNAGAGKAQDASENSFWFGLGYSGAAALTAILIPLLLLFGLQAAKHLLPAPESYADSLTGPPIVVTLVVIAGVIGLLAVLMMTALAFSSVKLSDSTQALGLPEGSVRAVIALSLIVIFVIIVVFLFGSLGTQVNTVAHLTEDQIKAIPANLIAGGKRSEEEPKRREADVLRKKADEIKDKNPPDFAKADAEAKTAANEAEAAKNLYTVDRYVEASQSSADLAKQIITTISTLVVSISAFYFGSTTAISAAKSGAASGAPVITKQPNDLKVKVDEGAKFSVSATGANLSYQWQKTTGTETHDISGATNNTYEITKVALADNGSKFSCKVTNLAGTTLSSAATLTVTAISAAKNGAASDAPVITKQPADLNLKVGDAAKFSVGATGSNLSYQWQKTTDAGTNGILGETNDTYEIAAVTLADNGSKFSCKITNLGGTTSSTAAKLIVT